ncbi:hypothetical protein E2562_006196 [Oryza meyeriana var. granulata]|uniref:Uncharacterized protein n=1 Tax=Oryza meyeriana var. granulata TaxID=110450 RepID=A0A6G1CNR9_9ORYZ|nr:hypothetical protein E2562_006196 [Oryza meyeriana var. granulata]
MRKTYGPLIQAEKEKGKEEHLITVSPTSKKIPTATNAVDEEDADIDRIWPNLADDEEDTHRC